MIIILHIHSKENVKIKSENEFQKKKKMLKYSE